MSDFDWNSAMRDLVQGLYREDYVKDNPAVFEPSPPTKRTKEDLDAKGLWTVEDEKGTTVSFVPPSPYKYEITTPDFTYAREFKAEFIAEVDRKTFELLLKKEEVEELAGESIADAFVEAIEEIQAKNLEHLTVPVQETSYDF